MGTKTKGVGAGRAADLRFIEGVGRSVSEYATCSKIIVEKSTVPVKTAEALDRVLSSNKGANTFWILSNPEFLAEGTAMKDLSKPDRVLIGGSASNEGMAAARVLADVYAIVVLTEWDEFKGYNYQEFYNTMQKPAFIFDGRGILKHGDLEDIGFEVHTIGKGRSKDGKLMLLRSLTATA